MTLRTTYDLELGTMMKILFPLVFVFIAVVGGFGVVTAVQEDPRSVPFFIVWYGVLAFLNQFTGFLDWLHDSLPRTHAFR